MEILVSGSIAYDRIMVFPGKFSEHIMPDKIHILNLSLTVSSLAENFGGTAGNIAYALTLLGEKPRILASIGYDYHRYFDWLKQCHTSIADIRTAEDEATAAAYIITDLADNQITVFNPGAMKCQSGFDFSQVNPQACIAIMAPGNLQDMMQYCQACHERGIFSIFDPGQSLPAWDGEALKQCLTQSELLVSNDYELELIRNKTGLSTNGLLALVPVIVTTKGGDGSEVVTPRGAVRIPSIPTDNVLDPTGAGDAFRAGLIKGLGQSHTVERAAMMGTVCAHYVIQHRGTQGYKFTMEEFNSKLQQYFPE